MRKTVFITGVLFVLVFTSMLGAIVQMNDIARGFAQSWQAEIESAVVEGAIHYLQGKSQADFLICELEKSARQPFNYEEALVYADKAMAELNLSMKAYTQSIDSGKQAGYDADIQRKFLSFDYDKFTATKQMNSDVMVLVRAYLACGNVLGAYQQNADNIANIYMTLYHIREMLVNHRVPEVELFSKLVQQLAESSLFGNYCTTTATAVFAQ